MTKKVQTHGVSTIPSAVLLGLDASEVRLCKTLLAPLPVHAFDDTAAAAARVLEVQAHIVLVGAGVSGDARDAMKEAAAACGAALLDVPITGDPWVLQRIFHDALRDVERRRKV